MGHTYAERRRAENTAHEQIAAPAQPSTEALRSGTAVPTREQMGQRVDLPDVMREKMENAFGADLSAVKLYESEAVADAGANAVTRASDIAFAPGMLDFTSYGGQALLGHEISHVVSQQRGEVTGGGFLNDPMLEARADREGAMAAAGQQISAPAAPLSAVGTASSAGPMQAKKPAKSDRKTPGAEVTDLRSAYRGVTAAHSALDPNDPQSQAAFDSAWGSFSEMAKGSSRGARGIISNATKNARETFNRNGGRNPSGLLGAVNFENAFKQARKGKAYSPLDSLP